MPASDPTRSVAPTYHAWLRALILLILPSTAVGVVLATHGPRWAVMWALAISIFVDCKLLTWWHRPVQAVNTRRAVLYFAAWPGMDAAAFFDEELRPQRPAIFEWLAAVFKLIVGIALLYGAGWMPIASPYLQGWRGLVGLALCMHFGAFHLISCAFRAGGIEARPLMNRPLNSVRLADFWGVRWNTAFRDLTHQFLFKPLTRRFGPRGAVWAGFFVSGLVHDAVISPPAGGGYGGPTLFFLLQPVGMFAERSRVGRRLGLGRGVRGWLFTTAFILLPAPLLFHRPYVVHIILPFMRAIGALP